MATEKYETSGLIKVLDFEEIEENAPLSTMAESEAIESEDPTTSRERTSQCRGDSKDMATQSNPASTPATEEQSAEEELEETSLLETEGGCVKP